MHKSASDYVISAAEHNNLELLREHIPNASSDALDTALWVAAYYGNAQIIQELIPISNPLANDMQALRMAAQTNCVECIQLLLPVSDPQGDKSDILWDACMYFANEAIACLIPFSKNCARGLTVCVSHHNLEGIELLLPVSDLKANNSRPLQIAVEAKFLPLIDVLYPLSEPKKALKALQQRWPGRPEQWEELERRMAQDQRNRIEGKVKTAKPTGARKKM